MRTQKTYRQLLTSSVATTVALGLLGTTAATGVAQTDTGADVANTTQTNASDDAQVAGVVAKAAQALEGVDDPFTEASGIDTVSDFDFNKLGASLTGEVGQNESITDKQAKAVADQLITTVTPDVTLYSATDVTAEGEAVEDDEAATARANEAVDAENVVADNTLRGTWNLDIDEFISKFGSSLNAKQDNFLAMVELPEGVDESTLRLTRMRDNADMELGFGTEGGTQVLTFPAHRGETYTLTADITGVERNFAPTLLGTVLPVNEQVSSPIYFTARAVDEALSTTQSPSATTVKETVRETATVQETVKETVKETVRDTQAPSSTSQSAGGGVPGFDLDTAHKVEMANILGSLGYVVNEQGNLVVASNGKPVDWTNSAVAVEGMRLAALLEGALSGGVSLSEIEPSVKKHIDNISREIEIAARASTVTVTVTQGAGGGNVNSQPGGAGVTTQNQSAGRGDVTVAIDPDTGNVRVINTSEPQPQNSTVVSTPGNQSGSGTTEGGSAPATTSGNQKTVTVTPTPTVTVTQGDTSTTTSSSTTTTTSSTGKFDEYKELATILTALMGGSSLLGGGNSNTLRWGGNATTTPSPLDGRVSVNPETGEVEASTGTSTGDVDSARPESNGVKTRYNENGEVEEQVYFEDGTATTTRTPSGGGDVYQDTPYTDNGGYGQSDSYDPQGGYEGSSGGASNGASGGEYYPEEPEASGETYEDGYDPYADYNGDGVVDEADYDVYYNEAASGALPVTGSASRTVGVAAGLALLATLALGGWMVVRRRNEAA